MARVYKYDPPTFSAYTERPGGKLVLLARTFTVEGKFTQAQKCAKVAELEAATGEPVTLLVRYQRWHSNNQWGGSFSRGVDMTDYRQSATGRWYIAQRKRFTT